MHLVEHKQAAELSAQAAAALSALEIEVNYIVIQKFAWSEILQILPATSHQSLRTDVVCSALGTQRLTRTALGAPRDSLGLHSATHLVTTTAKSQLLCALSFLRSLRPNCIICLSSASHVIAYHISCTSPPLLSQRFGLTDLLSAVRNLLAAAAPESLGTCWCTPIGTWLIRSSFQTRKCALHLDEESSGGRAVEGEQ